MLQKTDLRMKGESSEEIGCLKLHFPSSEQICHCHISASDMPGRVSRHQPGEVDASPAVSCDVQTLGLRPSRKLHTSLTSTGVRAHQPSYYWHVSFRVPASYSPSARVGGSRITGRRASHGAKGTVTSRVNTCYTRIKRWGDTNTLQASVTVTDTDKQRDEMLLECYE